VIALVTALSVQSLAVIPSVIVLVTSLSVIRVLAALVTALSVPEGHNTPIECPRRTCSTK